MPKERLATTGVSATDVTSGFLYWRKL